MEPPPSASRRFTFYFGSRRSSVSAGAFGAGGSSAGASSTGGFFAAGETGVLGLVALSSDFVVAMEKKVWRIHGLGSGRLLRLHRCARRIQYLLAFLEIAAQQSGDVLGARSQDDLDRIHTSGGQGLRLVLANAKCLGH